jgi:hypothetical protein
MHIYVTHVYNRSRLSRMIDVSNVLRKRSPLSCRRKSRLLTSKSNGTGDQSFGPRNFRLKKRRITIIYIRTL